YTTVSGGGASIGTISGQVIPVTGITLAGGASLTLTYGDTSSGAHPGAAAIVTATTGSSSFTTSEKSSAGGSLSGGPSASTNVDAADGSGTNSVSPTSVT